MISADLKAALLAIHLFASVCLLMASGERVQWPAMQRPAVQRR